MIYPLVVVREDIYFPLTRSRIKMSKITPTALTSHSPSDPRWELTQRVADSAYFRKGPKLRAFLLYACENAVLERLENLTAQLIGSRVFGRSPEYNLSEDNIVRVEAREVRRRLEAYFASEGRDEPIIIEIPKGGYVPIFKPREQAAPEVVEMKASGPVEAVPSPEHRANRWLVPVLATGFLVSTAAALWLMAENWQSQQPPNVPGAGLTASARDYAVYDAFLGTLGTVPDRVPLLVLSNPKTILYYGSESNAPLVQDPATTIAAPAELKTSFDFALNSRDRGLPFRFLRYRKQGVTGMGEAVAAFHLGRLMQFLHRPVHLTESRFLNWDHVQKQDVILLGGPASNDWTYQNDAKSNFVFTLPNVENLKPLPGEQKTYVTQMGAAASSLTIDYGLLKMLTTPYGFRTFLLAGVTSAGTAGVAEFFASPRKMKDVYERIRASAPGQPFPSDWEAVIRISVRDGLPIETAAVALRPAPAR